MLTRLLLTFAVVATPAVASAADFLDSFTLTRECGRHSVYVGPNRADLHGGVCLGFDEGVFKLHTSYSTSTACAFNGVYVGPFRPDLHGGHCLWADGFNLQTRATRSRTCRLNEVYVGPNRPEVHGGFCLSVVGRN